MIDVTQHGFEVVSRAPAGEKPTLDRWFKTFCDRVANKEWKEESYASKPRNDRGLTFTITYEQTNGRFKNTLYIRFCAAHDWHEISVVLKVDALSHYDDSIRDGWFRRDLEVDGGHEPGSVNSNGSCSDEMIAELNKTAAKFMEKFNVTRNIMLESFESGAKAVKL
jgi:hypothetical protein